MATDVPQRELPNVERPDEAAISAVTLGELHHGVLFTDDTRRPARLATLALV